MMAAAALAMATAGVLGLGTLYARDQRLERRQRRAAFDGCRNVLTDGTLSYEHTQYPILSGRFGDTPAELRLIVDTIHLRKLPVLWLSVTLRRPLDFPGVLAIMARASNNEFYSPFADLLQEIRIPPTWPEALRIRSEARDGAEDALRAALVQLEPEVLRYFADDRAKEILLTAKGIRLLYRASESERGHYLLTRLPKFSTDTLNETTVRGVLAHAVSLGNSLERAP